MLQSGQIQRAALRALAVEYGERRSAADFIRGMEMSGFPAKSDPWAGETEPLRQDEIRP